MWQFIALIVIGLIQIALGFYGIEYHLGAPWAFAALVVALLLRFLLPITIGSYFGAVDVMGWDWYIGVAIAAPGLLFLLPSMVMAAIESIQRPSREPKTHRPTPPSQSQSQLRNGSLSDATTDISPEKTDGFFTKIMKAVFKLIVNVLMALLSIGMLWVILR